jgi:hypothetical protein
MSTTPNTKKAAAPRKKPAAKKVTGIKLPTDFSQYPTPTLEEIEEMRKVEMLDFEDRMHQYISVVKKVLSETDLKALFPGGGKRTKEDFIASAFPAVIRRATLDTPESVNKIVDTAVLLGEAMYERLSKTV